MSGFCMAQKGKKEPAEIWQNIAGTGIDVQVPAAKLGEWAEQARKEGRRPVFRD